MSRRCLSASSRPGARVAGMPSSRSTSRQTWWPIPPLPPPPWSCHMTWPGSALTSQETREKILRIVLTPQLKKKEKKKLKRGTDTALFAIRLIQTFLESVSNTPSSPHLAVHLPRDH